MVCCFELEVLWEMRFGFLLDQEAAMDVSFGKKEGSLGQSISQKQLSVTSCK
jgi:hypothetical protein